MVLKAEHVTVTLNEQLQCVERELEYRVRVYDRRVKEKKMTEKLRDRELARMRAVRATLKILTESHLKFDQIVVMDWR